ncbi:UNVERIFIED_CONTAM: hypothetical protein PYX00_003414 [Menopon gallinae]|uniref:Uncharacterized protein n=1 Tax=Menopon gallinae TaxID=328185 RepID=A0AAW2I0A4_9NEOP
MQSSHPLSSTSFTTTSSYADFLAIFFSGLSSFISFKFLFSSSISSSDFLISISYILIVSAWSSTIFFINSESPSTAAKVSVALSSTGTANFFSIPFPCSRSNISFCDCSQISCFRSHSFSLVNCASSREIISSSIFLIYPSNCSSSPIKNRFCRLARTSSNLMVVPLLYQAIICFVSSVEEAKTPSSPSSFIVNSSFLTAYSSISLFSSFIRFLSSSCITFNFRFIL